MCDEEFFAKLSRRGEAERLTRREFTALSASAGAAMLLPRAADAQEVSGMKVDVPTADGAADCYLTHPVSGAHPGVAIWPDARGLRETYHGMADRLAEHGYTVLVLNPYYRSARAPVLPEGADPRDSDTMEVLRPMLAELSPETEEVDARGLVEYLEDHPSVDRSRQMGTMGYCLGGPGTFRTAALFPDLIGAGASFHGIRLVTEEPTSPHLLIPEIDARFLVAIAEDDDENNPEAKRVLREAFADAGLAAEVEVYEGAMHSWCTPDSPVYNREQAERAWSRLLDLFSTALA